MLVKEILSNPFSALSASSSGFLFSKSLSDLRSAKIMPRTTGPADVTLAFWPRISIGHLQKCQCFNQGQESQESMFSEYDKS